MSRKGSDNTAATAAASSSASSPFDLDDEATAEERAATEADVQAMMCAVQAELQQSGAEHAAATSAGEGHDESKGEEADTVSLEDHFSMAGLTLDESNSASNSQSNSVAASPAIAPSAAAHTFAAASSPSSTAAASSAAAAVASATALSDLPPVELKDGGNAALAGSDVHIGSKQNFFDVRVAVVGNVDSGQTRELQHAGALLWRLQNRIGVGVYCTCRARCRRGGGRISRLVATLSHLLLRVALILRQIHFDRCADGRFPRQRSWFGPQQSVHPRSRAGYGSYFRHQPAYYGFRRSGPACTPDRRRFGSLSSEEQIMGTSRTCVQISHHLHRPCRT